MKTEALSMRFCRHVRIAVLAMAVVLGLTVQGQVYCAPVYRFWSDYYGGHFFTIRRSERDSIIATYADVWSYEGSDWSALTSPEDGAVPVYRFWSPFYQSHFFTISETEKNYIIKNYQGWWNYEGIGWYAYMFEGPRRKPIFRFWSDLYQSHFYTGNAEERDYIIQNFPAWNYEGVAWYAPISECIDLSGEWYVEETLNLRCTQSGETYTDSQSGSGWTYITQSGCNISYPMIGDEIMGLDIVREGTVDGNLVNVTGPLFFETDPSVITFDTNVMSASGEATSDTISLNVTGWASGTESELPFSCTATSNALFMRFDTGY